MDLPGSDQELSAQDELRRLYEENARLKALLTRHSINWQTPTTPEPAPAPTEHASIPTRFTTDAKIVSGALPDREHRLTGAIRRMAGAGGAMYSGRRLHRLLNLNG